MNQLSQSPTVTQSNRLVFLSFDDFLIHQCLLSSFLPSFLNSLKRFGLFVENLMNLMKHCYQCFLIFLEVEMHLNLLLAELDWDFEDVLFV